MSNICRVRRGRTVYFVEFRPSDTVTALKSKLSRLTDAEREPKDLRLQILKNDSYITLDDVMQAEQAGITDDAVVYMTYRTSPGGEHLGLPRHIACSDEMLTGTDWESVDVPDYEDLTEDVEEEAIDAKGKGRG